MRFHQTVRIVALALFLGGIAQADYLTSIELECPALPIINTAGAGSLSAVCPDNSNVNAFAEASGSALKVAINQPVYAHSWDTATAEVDDTFSVASSGLSGAGILRFTATISATTTAASWPSDAEVFMAIREPVGWGMCLPVIDSDTPGPVNCIFDQPFTFGADGSFKLELLGRVKGRGSVDASHTATYQIAGVYLEDGTPVTNYDFTSGSGERYGLAPLDTGVPEPATIVLIGSPLLLMVLRRRRRGQQGGARLPVVSQVRRDRETA